MLVSVLVSIMQIWGNVYVVGMDVLFVRICRINVVVVRMGIICLGADVWDNVHKDISQHWQQHTQVSANPAQPISQAAKSAQIQQPASSANQTTT